MSLSHTMFKEKILFYLDERKAADLAAIVLDLSVYISKL